MKQRIIASFVALLCFALGYASNIQVDDVSLRPGETNSLKISMASIVSGVVGVQFDIKLPDGCLLASNAGKVFQVSSNQANDMTCNVNELGSNSFRIILYSGSLQRLNTGELISLNLKAKSSMALGNYPVVLSNVAFSDIDGNVTKESEATATVKVTRFFPNTQNLNVEDVTIKSGETAPISLSLLESISGCVGIQFDLSLPDGFSLEKDGSGKEYAIATNQASDVTCNLTALSNGAYRFVMYSNSLKEFVPGELMNINLKVNKEKPLETYSVSIHDVQLSDISGNVHNDNGANANVKVTNYFTLVYIVDGVEYKTKSIEYGSTITAETAPTKEGYSFSGWSEIPATMPAHDLAVTGSFSINSYTLTYIVDGVGYKVASVEYGTAITAESIPTKEGYTFSGWSEIPATMPAHDVIVTGTFSVNSYTLTYKVDGKDYKSYSIAYGTVINPETEPTKEGYTFSGWSEIPSTMPAHDVTVTGSFSINSYTLTYMIDGVEYKTASVEFGSAITAETAPTKDGYTFSGWSEIPKTMPAHDVTVTGSFSVNTYTITYMVDGQVYKTSAISYGTDIIAEANPKKEGYTFSGWNNIPKTMPAHDVTVTGTFIANKYNVYYLVDGELYGTSEAEYGVEVIPIEEPTKEGYTFSGWSEIPETMPAHDVTVTGSFSVNTYTITYMVDGAEYKTDEVEYGSSITAEAAPTKEGYTFSGWSEIPETMPAHDVTVTGKFTINKYKVTFVVDGQVYRTTEIEYGADVNPIEEPTKEGYTFSGWQNLPEDMPAHDVTVKGTFIVNHYKVTFMYGDNVLTTIEVAYGEAIELPTSLNSERYTLIEWLDVPKTMPAHDIIIYADYVDGIDTITADSKDVQYIQMNGMYTNVLKQGLNIIRAKDGTTKKVWVK